MVLLREKNESREAIQLLKELQQYDPNQIRDISLYYDELFKFLKECQSRFIAIDSDHELYVKEEIALFLRELTLSHCSWQSTIAQIALSDQRRVIDLYLEWTVHSEKVHSLSDFYYYMQYIRELLQLLPNPLQISESIQFWSHVNKIAKDLFSLNFLSAAISSSSLFVAIGKKGMQAIGEALKN